MYHLIFNGLAVKGKKSKYVEKVKSVFDGAGLDYKVYVTERTGHASEMAKEITSSEDGATIIACGGDGTLHEVLNGVADISSCRLGLIPIGTGNDFAAACHLPKNVSDAAKMIISREPVFIDCIELSSGLRSVNAVGMGIDVDILQRAYRGRYRGRLKYIFATIRALVRFKGYKFTIEIDGKTSEHFGILTCLGNGRQIGGGIRLFPTYLLNDGYMVVNLTDFVSRGKVIPQFLRIMAGNIEKLKAVTLVKAKKVRVTCDGPQRTIQAEGELYDGMPLEAEVVHGKLRFFLPEGIKELTDE
ncbi:MAG: diacylglycerol kinase family lipid kinase [Clostridia bacterium]|nr:diacylglycerol kinase family lipid kinase [Clostridia bacterium]